MEIKEKFDWFCKSTWSKSAYNTLWCLIGCSIGDFGTIYYFQITPHSFSIFLVMSIAIINGIITSIILETDFIFTQKKNLKLNVKEYLRLIPEIKSLVLQVKTVFNDRQY